MFITPFESYPTNRNFQFIWSLTDLTPAELMTCATGLAPGWGVLVDAHQSKTMRDSFPALRVFVREGGQCVRLASDGSSAETLEWFENRLPSQIAERTSRGVVALDIVMSDSTQSAWAEMERLIAGGLSAATAAAALVGTPAEIAHRLDNYRACGIRHVVLTAPPTRAPYQALTRDLLPLLSNGLSRTEPPPRRASIASGVIDWHGVAL